jgi:hypothetical protein
MFNVDNYPVQCKEQSEDQDGSKLLDLILGKKKMAYSMKAQEQQYFVSSLLKARHFHK